MQVILKREKEEIVNCLQCNSVFERGIKFFDRNSLFEEGESGFFEQKHEPSSARDNLATSLPAIFTSHQEASKSKCASRLERY